MYAIYSHRKRPDTATQSQARQRAREEFFPRLRQAPGFVSFTLVEGEDGTNLVVMLWESRVAAEAFQGEAQRWQQILDQFAPLVSTGRGEVLEQLTPSPEAAHA